MTEVPRVVESELPVRDPRDVEYARLLEAERVARAEAERQRGAAERARAEAEAAARAKSAFLATMSHELRTPLNAIIGYAELLDLGIFGAVTPAQHAHLERLRASARHLLGLVSDVLDLAKIDAGRLEVRREPAVTGMPIAAALALVQPQATTAPRRCRPRPATHGRTPRHPAPPPRLDRGAARTGTER
ncbi:MAG TPA: histidine kinase dimerization/phospho-acceptor domain-containing protein [Gemmatirosa sp.]